MASSTMDLRSATPPPPTPRLLVLVLVLLLLLLLLLLLPSSPVIADFVSSQLVLTHHPLDNGRRVQ